MDLGIFDIVVMAMVVFAIIYSFYREKNGPTEKERVKLEAKYGRVLNEDDIKSYKKSQKLWGIVMIFVFVMLVIGNLWA